MPQRVDSDQLVDIVARAYARYDPVALGAAIGAVVGAGLFLATAILLLKGGADVGSHLSLLGSYLIGFEISWLGAFVGLIEGCIGGYIFGYLLAKSINATIGIHRIALVGRLKAAAIMDAFEQGP